MLSNDSDGTRDMNHCRQTDRQTDRQTAESLGQ